MKEYTITVNDQAFHINIKKIQTDTAIVEVDGEEYVVGVDRKVVRQHVEPLDVKPVKKMPAATTSRPTTSTFSANDILSPLPGLIMKVFVKEGEKVTNGQVLLKMEAMKMENEIKANRSGVVSQIFVKDGDTVMENTPLVKLGD